MTIRLAQGSQIAIASGYGTDKTIDTISNANPGVAAFAAGHGIATADLFEVSSGWGRLNQRVIRAGTVAGDNVPLEGVNTTNVNLYPSGSGVPATAREITGWTSITQIEGVNSPPPSFSFVPATTFDDVVEKEIPGLEGVSGMDLTLFMDLALGWVNTVLTASDESALSAIRILLPGGAKVYSSAYWKMSRVPQLAVGQAVKGTIVLRFGATPIQYTS